MIGRDNEFFARRSLRIEQNFQFSFALGMRRKNKESKKAKGESGMLKKAEKKKCRDTESILQSSFLPWWRAR